jgi:shikimate dehydrogenase
MKEIVLIGDNIAHSLSPRLHNHLFERFDLPYRYSLMPLSGSRLSDAIARMRSGEYRGANVTSPYKQRVLPLLDELSAEAASIGAVNTIVVERGRLTGHNTDLYGFTRSLDGYPLFSSRFSAAVLGTGGAAMASVYALLKMAGLDSLVIYSREEERAARSAARWNDERVSGRAIDAFDPVDLLVHATPVGLAGNPGELLDRERLRGVKLLYEMIYSPSETALMRSAASVGVTTIGGMKMFIYQALRAFRLWTGIEVEADDLPDRFLSTEKPA